MSLTSTTAAEYVGEPGRFYRIIDARSPAEFAEDHLPGAVNWPVLDDEQRRIVGTLYKQESALAARKLGAAMVARNIATHVEQWVQDKPRDWQPLVYCWRGGQRSGSLAWFLGQIGFRSTQLDGGYKAWRAIVRDQLDELPQRFNYRVLCGRTGSGKTRLLTALADIGAQTLDLEGLACHRGSVLGAVPDRPQPAQKGFDTLLWRSLKDFDPRRPVFIESESRKVGALRVPEALIQHMRSHGECVLVQMADAARLDLLQQEYGFFADDVDGFCRLLESLLPMRGRDMVNGWQDGARAGRWREVFGELMQQHYDPLYERSLKRNFLQLDEGRKIELSDGDPLTLRNAAEQLMS
ncbi:MAG: tRNA 2-selenouridine(34) synthase MnmH [Rubrivivax sp.]